MAETEVKKRLPARASARCGRPPRELAGEVDRRILEAARAVFLDRGFEGASIEEIADVARAGKPTIYARHASKEALFAAVVLRDIEDRLLFEDIETRGATLEERLTLLGEEFLRRGLRAETLGLLRSVIAEARRFPELASGVSKAARAQIDDRVFRLLSTAEESTNARLRTNGDAAGLTDAARVFTDLVFQPFVFRALLGEPLGSLRAEIPGHVASRVALFLRLCAQR